jgi:apolipoprotein D and lipocalin family protein
LAGRKKAAGSECGIIATATGLRVIEGGNLVCMNRIMKAILYSLFLFASLTLTAQSPPDTLDLHKFSGKWYVIASIPACFDKNWNNITETFEVKDNGNVNIYMTYVRKGETEIRDSKAKGFPYKENKNTEWEVQFVWPFTSDFLVEELGPDYSYVVVGHPQKLYFYIMTRTGSMDETLYSDIMKRFMKKGYEINDLRIVAQ